MAKSLRSKKMRKLRAFKRIRYGEKELARLKNMLDKAAEEEKQNVATISETDVELVEPTSTETPEPVMEVETENVKTEVTKPPKYPSWLSHFKVKKLAKVERKCKRKEAKRLKKEQKKSLNKGKGKKKNKGK